MLKALDKCLLSIWARGLFGLCLVTIAGASCVSRFSDNARPRVLVPMAELKREVWMQGETPRQLGFARDNDIQHTIWKVTVDDDAAPPFQATLNTIARVQFGRLSRAHYDLLMTRYGGKNFVAYDPEHDYWLEDFLPPKMQAYVNRWLFPQDEVKEDLPWQVGDFRSPRFRDKQAPTAAIGMNCWTTLLDIYRDLSLPPQQQTAMFFYVNADEARKQFEANAKRVEGRSVDKHGLELNDKSPRERNSGRVFGDLLYIKSSFQPFGPAHVAMWIDEDLYFEKTNFSENDPIRLAFFEQVIEPYLDQDRPDDPEARLQFWFLPQSLKNNMADRDAAIPGPQRYAGDYPFDVVPGETMTRAEVLADLERRGVRGKYYFTLDTGLGGGMTAYSIAQHVSMKLGREEPKRTEAKKEHLRRAYFVGSDKLSTFSQDDVFCRSGDETAGEPSEGQMPPAFDYVITTSGELRVRSRVTGQRVATLAPRFLEENQDLSLGDSFVVKSEVNRMIYDMFKGKMVETVTENIVIFPIDAADPAKRRLVSVFVPKQANRPVFIEHLAGLKDPIELRCDGDIRSLARLVLQAP